MEQDISYLVPQIFRNQGVKVQNDTKQTQEVKAKRTAKNNVFLNLYQDKKKGIFTKIQSGGRTI